MRWLYWPLRIRLMASPNQKYSTSSMADAGQADARPQEAPLTQPEAPIIVTSIDMPASQRPSGWTGHEIIRRGMCYVNSSSSPSIKLRIID
jgi:hypothetical protein